MIEIGDNLQSVLTTVAVFGGLGLIAWATNRPARRERRRDRKDEE